MPMRTGDPPACTRSAVKQGHHVDHLLRRTDGMPCAVVERLWCAEYRHQPVAHHLVDDATVRGDRVEHQRVVVVQQVDRVLGLHLFGHRREPADVDEQDRDLDAASAEGESGSCEVVCDAGCRESSDDVRLLVAQSLLLQRRVEPGAEQDRVDRLGKVVLGTQLEAPDDVVETLERRRDDDGDVAERTILA